MRIEQDDLTSPQVLDLLQEHLSNMHELSPPDQVFAFDAAKLQAPGVSFWTVWEANELVGCGALKELSALHAEVKSMRTPKAARRRGAGKAMMEHILTTARKRGYERLSLETGTHVDFGPAHRLYEGYGFVLCGPFSSYAENENSVFMTLVLDARA